MGEYAEYAILGYAMMGVVLGGMVLWIYIRYLNLRREQQLIAQMEAEEGLDRVRQATGAVEDDAQPEDAAPGQSGMAGPGSDRARTLPG